MTHSTIGMRLVALSRSNSPHDGRYGQRTTVKTRPNCDSDNAIEINGANLRRIITLSKARWVWFDTKSTEEGTVQKDAGVPRGIRLGWFLGLIVSAVDRQGRFEFAVAIFHEGEMPRARRLEKGTQNGLEIHLRVPRLPGPSPRVKHKQMLLFMLFHAEAKSLCPRWYVKTTQKHLLVRFLYALGPKLICFSSYGPRKLLGMSQEQLL